jgi:tetratricopeptide (TPR) repeat protein
VLAHHYQTALELAIAVGDVDLARALVDPTVRNLELAGHRALALDVAAAEQRYARALELADADDPRRPALNVCWADALKQGRRYREAADALGEAIADFAAMGDIRHEAQAMMRLAEVRSWLGDREVMELGAAAMALLADDGPSLEKAEVLTTWGYGQWTVAGDAAAAIDMVGQAIAIYEELGSTEPVRALGMLAGARCDLGDRRGLDDYRRAFAAAQAQGLGAERSLLYANYASVIWSVEGPRASLEVLKEGLDFAHRRGSQEDAVFIQAARMSTLADLGEWDEALAEAADLVPTLEAAGDVWNLLAVRSYQALTLARRGRARDAEPFLSSLVEKARQSESVIQKMHALIAASATHLGLGEAEPTTGLLGEVAAITHVGDGMDCALEFVPEAVRLALAQGAPDLARRLAGGLTSALPATAHTVASVDGLLAEAGDDQPGAVATFTTAAAGWHDFSVPYEEAQALLGQGRCLVALGRAPDAAAPLAAAHEIFARLGAEPALQETDRVLSAARLEESS